MTRNEINSSIRRIEINFRRARNNYEQDICIPLLKRLYAQKKLMNPKTTIPHYARPSKEQIEDLPVLILNALKHGGLVPSDSEEKLTSLTKHDLLKFKGMGKSGIQKIELYLSKKGLSLKQPNL